MTTPRHIVANHDTARLSVTYALLAGAHVVSVFPIVDGEVNTDDDLYFREFSDSKLAIKAFLDLEVGAKLAETSGRDARFVIGVAIDRLNWSLSRLSASV